MSGRCRHGFLVLYQNNINIIRLHPIPMIKLNDKDIIESYNNGNYLIKSGVPYNDDRMMTHYYASIKCSHIINIKMYDKVRNIIYNQIRNLYDLRQNL